MNSYCITLCQPGSSAALGGLSSCKWHGISKKSLLLLWKISTWTWSSIIDYGCLWYSSIEHMNNYICEFYCIAHACWVKNKWVSVSWVENPLNSGGYKSRPSRAAQWRVWESRQWQGTNIDILLWNDVAPWTMALRVFSSILYW